MCCYDIEPHPLRLSEGALLLDQGYLTAIKQFDTYLQSHLSTTVALFVRIGYFMTWIQDVVLDPVPSKVRIFIPVRIRVALNITIIIRLRAIFITLAFNGELSILGVTRELLIIKGCFIYCVEFKNSKKHTHFVEFEHFIVF